MTESHGKLAIGCLGVIYAAPVLTMTGWATRGQAARSIVTLILVALLCAIVIGVLTRSWRRFFLVQLPLWVLSLGFVGYTLLFNMPPGRTLAHILAAASAEELFGFLQFRPELLLVAVTTLWSVVYLGLCFAVPSKWNFGSGRRALSRPFVLMLLPLTAYCAFDPAEMIDGAALDPIVGSLIFLGGQIPEARDELGGSRVVKRPYGAKRVESEEVDILVVGESARKSSWSSYGYSRPTTPMLDSMAGKIIWLGDAIADANLTDWAVPIMLTGMSPVGFDMAKVRGNLFDLAREAGYHTAWLVNQDVAVSDSVGVKADDLIYPPDFDMNINGRHALDEVLLPGYTKELARAGSPRFIGIHIMGSHWEYYRRYSPAFQRYGSSAQMHRLSMVSVLVGSAESESALVDAYDDTVLYTDWFLHELIERANSLQVPATLMFFPDHGEDLASLDGATGHGGPRYTRHAFEIPAFVWVNAAFRQRHPDRVAALEVNSKREIRTHNVFYTEADLMGIHWPGEAPRLSFACPEFVADDAMKHVAGGILVSRTD